MACRYTPSLPASRPPCVGPPASCDEGLAPQIGLELQFIRKLASYDNAVITAVGVFDSTDLCSNEAENPCRNEAE